MCHRSNREQETTISSSTLVAIVEIIVDVTVEGTGCGENDFMALWKLKEK